jgi:hypothetical protein
MSYFLNNVYVLMENEHHTLEANVKLLIGIFVIITLLVGCKTTEQLAGSGSVIVSAQTKKSLDKHTANDGAVALAYNGRYWYSWTCPCKNCCYQVGIDAQVVIDRCELKAPRCGIYSYNGFVLWKGDVRVKGQASTSGGSDSGVKNTVSKTGSNDKKMNLSEAKKECASIGLKVGSESFGLCVMKFVK